MRVKKGRFHEPSWCRAAVGKEHSFHERHPALSIMSDTKDEEGELAAPHRQGPEEEESEAEEGESHI